MKQKKRTFITAVALATLLFSFASFDEGTGHGFVSTDEGGAGNGLLSNEEGLNHGFVSNDSENPGHGLLSNDEGGAGHGLVSNAEGNHGKFERSPHLDEGIKKFTEGGHSKLSNDESIRSITSVEPTGHGFALIDDGVKNYSEQPGHGFLTNADGSHGKLVEGYGKNYSDKPGHGLVLKDEGGAGSGFLSNEEGGSNGGLLCTNDGIHG